MKLRSFMYLNHDMLNSYLSAIDGGIHDSEIITHTHTNQKGGNVDVNAGMFSAGAQIGKGGSAEVTKTVQINHPARFERLFSYLQQNNQAKYYQAIDNNIFDSLSRDDFIEVLVKPRFSKIKELANTAKSLGTLLDVFQSFTEETVFDEKTKQDVDNVSRLGDLKTSKTISCVLNFEDGAFPIVSDLDEQHFIVPQENFVGEVYVLCKIQRKLQKGEKIELDEIFEQLQKIPLNREQRRQMPKKDLKNPKEFKDVISDPAFTASVIAVYQ